MTGADRRRFSPGALLAALDRDRVQHVVLGGVAATLLGSDRPTHNADVVPERSPQNLRRLATMLGRVQAGIWTPQFDRPIDVVFDAPVLVAVPILRTRTAHGDLNLVFEPAGLPGGYREIVDRARDLVSNGLSVKVAGPLDLIRSAASLDRLKDRDALPTLWALHARDEREPIRRAAAQTLDAAEPAPVRDPVHEALAASRRLAVLFDDVRPALACVRRQLTAALDDSMYAAAPGLVERRIFLARRAALSALQSLGQVRADLEPEVTSDRRRDAPVTRGDNDLGANLAYQAEDRIMMAVQALGSAARESASHDLTSRLTEARLHTSNADASWT